MVTLMILPGIGDVTRPADDWMAPDLAHFLGTGLLNA